MENLPQFPGEDVNNGRTALIVGWVEGSLAMLFVVLRIFTRLRLVRAFGWDDGMIIVAMLLSLITTALITVQVAYGVGRHSIFLDPHQMQMSVKYIYLTQIPSTFSSCFGKIAVALLLKRIIAPNRAMALFLWFVIISLLIVNVFVNIFILTYCKPLAFLWDRSLRGSCLPNSVLRDTGYLQGSWSIFGDVTLALFPILIVRKSQMKLRVKIGLILAMSLGIFAAIAASLKTAELKDLSSTRDQIYDAPRLIYYYSTENNLVIIAACIPTLKQLLVRTSQLYSTYTARGNIVEHESLGRRNYPRRMKYRRHNDLGDSELAVLESHVSNAPIIYTSPATENTEICT